MKKYMSAFLCLVMAFSLFSLPAAALEIPTPAVAAAIVVDATHGDVIFAQNADTHSFPASITKVMTAMLVLEEVEAGRISLDEVITASETYHQGLTSDGSTQNIKTGEEMTVRHLLYCALVASANEACNILAERVSGNLADFVVLMNARALELGMEDTNFVNAHGLHNANHYTTARDVSKMVVHALENTTFREIVSTPGHKVPATNLSDSRNFYNTNALITRFNITGYLYPYAIGVKTGSTPEAGNCLASAAVKNGTTLVCVVLGAENVKQTDGTIRRNSFAESKALLEYGFNNFTRKTVLDSATPVKEIPVTLSSKVSAVSLQPQVSLDATLPKDLDPKTFTREITAYYQQVQAPITAGQVLGEITIKNGDTTYGTVKLVATVDVERSELLYRLHQIKEFLSQTWVKVALVAVGILVLVLLLRFTLHKPHNSRRRNRRGR